SIVNPRLWPEVAFTLFSIAVVAVLVPPLPLAVYFGICLFFIVLHRVAPPAFSTAVQIGGILVTILLLLFYKSSPLLFNHQVMAWLGRVAPDYPSWLSSKMLVTLGVSYCFLRFVYAIRDPRVTTWQFIRYYFFFPTFLSGPVLAPRAFLSQRISITCDDFL